MASRRDSDPDFGPALYEKDLSLSPEGLTVRGLFAALVTIIGIGAVIGGLADRQWAACLVGVAMMVVAPTAWYFLAYRDRVNWFRFFRHGLEQGSRAGTRRLAYSDVVSFAYN